MNEELQLKQEREFIKLKKLRKLKVSLDYTVNGGRLIERDFAYLQEMESLEELEF